MMTFTNYDCRSKLNDPKPGWWTAERMDYCEITAGQKAHKKNILLRMLLTMFA